MIIRCDNPADHFLVLNDELAVDEWDATCLRCFPDPHPKGETHEHEATHAR